MFKMRYLYQKIIDDLTHFASEMLPAHVQMTSTSGANQHSYRPEIDGIRAFAVIAVIINHFNKDLLPSGYLGVDIFFVISGFVITSSLAGRSSKNFFDFLVGFYARRMKRLVPALVMFVVITSILICLFNPSPGLSIMTAIAALFGCSNLYLLNQSTNYFADSTQLNVFTHTWSLGVEEQFYFLFPLLVWFTGFGRQASKGARNLFWVTGVLSIASLIAFVHIYRINQPAAYFLMPTRFWEMGAGCLLFLGLKHPSGLRVRLQSIPPLVVTAGIVAVLFIPLQFAAKATIAVVLFTSVLIACLHTGTAGYSLFTHPQVVYIGLISYSLYLWHWGVLSLSRWTIGIHWWSVPFQVALMLLLAVFSYRYVEIPLRRSDWSVLRWRTIGYGISACVIASVLLLLLSNSLSDRIFLGSRHSVETENLTVQGIKLYDCSFFQGKGMSVSTTDIAKSRCSFPKGERVSGQQRIWYLGNSHALHLSGLIGKMQSRGDYQQTVIATAQMTFPTLPLEVYDWLPKNDWKQKDLLNQEKTIKYVLANVKSGDIIVLGNDLGNLFGWYPGKWETERQRNLQFLPGWIKNLDTFIKTADARGASVIAFLPMPRFQSMPKDFTTENCYKQWFRPFLTNDCYLFADRIKLRQGLTEVTDSLKTLSKSNSNFYLFDPFDRLCPKDLKNCSTVLSDRVIFRDSHHINNYGGELLFDDFYALLLHYKLLKTP
ncbi:acyltransferase family protein [Calothrix sp. PCC 7507]|uniref:acyltransferase family protein n=1 Tax=Calothrix sp. PCC 7507 TaxID=99598 RepID=UPI00029F4375|nr:acyltransferase family protein [Calothrix sp. PCC 7507]AFY33790.1 acyltransferase 3 [Calothrix sp. PCC 7507]